MGIEKFGPERISMRLMLTLLLLFALVGPAPALAVDGVLEINETCAVQTGCFSGDTAGYPVTIDGTAGSSYRLTSNLTVPSENTTAVQINSNDVTLDLNGFAIRGITTCSGTGLTLNCSPTGTGSGVSSSSNRLIVQNGTISAMGSRGITLGGVDHLVKGVVVSGNGGVGIRVGIRATVTNVVSTLNGSQGILTSGTSRVTDSIAQDNGSNGIDCGGVNAPFVAHGNTSRRNRFAGISCSGGGTTAIGNSVFNNGGDGIRVGVGGTIVNNSAFANDGDGIEAGAGSLVSDNAVRLNDGLGLALGADSGYRGNVLSGNLGGNVAGGLNLGGNACGGSLCP
jgi:hypothetical protein